MLIDTHLHIYDLMECFVAETPPLETLPETLFCSSSHYSDEFEQTCRFCENNKLAAFYSFGIHPQCPSLTELDTLVALARTKRIQAIGEIGFDLYTDAFKETLPAQQVAWHEQIKLAKSFSLPVVLHLRKAMHLVFEQTSVLKKLPAVVFHGWHGSPAEASSLLKKGVNAYFSLGKALLRLQKTALQTAAIIPLERLLTETDAPYMNSKGEAFSHASDIIAVTQKLAQLRFEQMQSESCCTANSAQDFLHGTLMPQLEKNFRSVFHS